MKVRLVARTGLSLPLGKKASDTTLVYAALRLNTNDELLSQHQQYLERSSLFTVQQIWGVPSDLCAGKLRLFREAVGEPF